MGVLARCLRCGRRLGSVSFVTAGIAQTLITVIVTALIHELGHIVAALSMGLTVKRLGLCWKGLFIVRDTGSPVANLITTFAGPGANLMCALAFWSGAPQFAFANLMLGLMNLLPFNGSDGQRAYTVLRLIRS
jgi:Zn-dependent protease